MCLDTKKSRKELQKWKKTIPDEIICYKIVVNHSAGCEPLFSIYNPLRLLFSKKNVSKTLKKRVKTFYGKSTYYPYFHFYLKKSAAEKVKFSSLTTAIKECKIKKSVITAMGTQYKEDVIVAKEFEFVNPNRNVVNSTTIWNKK